MDDVHVIVGYRTMSIVAAISDTTKLIYAVYYMFLFLTHNSL